MYTRLCSCAVLALLGVTSFAIAQLPPEIGYVHPAGGQAGTTTEVKIGGYDWTPDTQVFVHDPRVKLEIVGPPSGVLVPDPPYWFGSKGRGYAWPCPREFPARLTIAADAPPGLIKFQVANANGASPPGFLHVGSAPDVMEQANSKAPQVLPQLPVSVSGQVRLIEEIDRYEFTAPKAGPITLELFARRFNSMLHGLLKVHDANGKLVLDRADTEGRDFAASFIAQAGMKYTVSLHDLDYAGDFSYVYRLAITPSPLVAAAYPTGGKRGETREVEFVGLGLATGANQLESVKANVAFPAGADPALQYMLETPQGKALPVALQLSNIAELVKAAGASEMPLASVPCAVTGALTARFGSDRFTLNLKKDEKWKFTAQARAIGSPLDLDLALVGPDGKEIVRNDDAPGTTDPLLTYVVPGDGAYTLLLSDTSGKSGTRDANYRLLIEPHVEDFSLTVPTQLPVPLGAVAKLPLKIVREAGFKSPVQVTITGLPAGVTVPADLKFAEGAVDLMVDLTCAADAPASAAVATVTSTAQVAGQTVTRTAPILLATTMKPRIKLTPEGLDDVRKVNRGSTFLAPVLIERLEGYAGEITLEMTAKQQRHRQGLSSGEFVVPADAKRVEYPIFVPEWMETTKTSRMILNGAVKVADPKGNVRTLLQRQELRIGILPEGALMKLSASKELTAQAGSELQVPLTLLRATEFSEPAKVELVPGTLPAGAVTAEPIVIGPQATASTLAVRLGGDATLVGEHSITFRATSLKDGKWPVVSEAKVMLLVK